MPHFSSETYASSPMSIVDYDKLLSSISHPDILLPTIDPVAHPGGFRICICDPSDREEVSQLEKNGAVFGAPSTESTPRAHELKRLANSIQWKNNYMLPWLTTHDLLLFSVDQGN
jgi:hypothetical protein